MPEVDLRCYKRRPVVVRFCILTMAKRDNFEFENSDNDDDLNETFGTAIQVQQETVSPRWEYSTSENFDYKSTTTSEEEEDDAAIDPEEKENLTTTVNTEKAIDDELALIENAYLGLQIDSCGQELIMMQTKMVRINNILLQIICGL